MNFHPVVHPLKLRLQQPRGQARLKPGDQNAIQVSLKGDRDPTPAATHPVTGWTRNRP